MVTTTPTKRASALIVSSQDRARGMASLKGMGKMGSSKYLLSWKTDSNNATVGDAEASPTPTPTSGSGLDDLGPVE